MKISRAENVSSVFAFLPEFLKCSNVLPFSAKLRKTCVLSSSRDPNLREAPRFSAKPAREKRRTTTQKTARAKLPARTPRSLPHPVCSDALRSLTARLSYRWPGERSKLMLTEFYEISQKLAPNSAKSAKFSATSRISCQNRSCQNRSRTLRMLARPACERPHQRPRRRSQAEVRSRSPALQTQALNLVKAIRSHSHTPNATAGDPRVETRGSAANAWENRRTCWKMEGGAGNV